MKGIPDEVIVGGAVVRPAKQEGVWRHDNSIGDLPHVFDPQIIGQIIAGNIDRGGTEIVELKPIIEFIGIGRVWEGGLV